MTLTVNLDSQSYKIVIERGVLLHVGQWLNLDRRVLIVTDSGVPASYGQTVADQCKEPVLVTLPQGEASKSFDQFRSLLSTMMRADFTRGDCVVAVGGGVMGDLAAFSASCYMRGIDFYNIPTTLLSQVDSSVGGKTAIDLDGVKNIIGSFFQPKAVMIDPDTLTTLDVRQLHAGLAESIKMACTCDADLFRMLETCDNLHKALPEIIHRSLCIKRDIVEQDPKEAGLRRVLNFGHTIGHAIESAANGQLLHGECVALGMLPMCAPAVRERLLPVLKKYELPTDITGRGEALLPYILHDKKMKAGQVTVVWVDEIGSFRLQPMSPEELIGILDRMRGKI